MLFKSFEFLVLLAVTFVLYYAPGSAGRHGKAWQVMVLLVASVVFYGWEDPRLIGLLAVSCIGNSIATGRMIQHKLAGRQDQVQWWMRMAVAMNLLLLAGFKYLGWLAGMMPFLPDTWIAAARDIPLPIGISFYTFHGISMIVDVARGEVTREGAALTTRGKSFVTGVRDIGLYLLFFPQLVAGPIVKAKQFWPQIRAKSMGSIPWRCVVRCLTVGYFLKIVVADNLAEHTASLTFGADLVRQFSGRLHELYAGFPLMALLYAYTLQIFADFAGYSLIAIGLAAMFGYQFPKNFNFPYLSTSITEFWRRWHMSLSAWLRDYLYIPLGGSRKGPGRTYTNLFLVMFLGGLWHGAEWKFVVWGCLHGLALAVERLVSRRQSFGSQRPETGVSEARDRNFGSQRSEFRPEGKAAEHSAGAFTDSYSETSASETPKLRLPKLRLLASGLRWFLTFHVVTFLWLTFLLPDFASVMAFLRALVTAPLSLNGPPIFALAVYGTPVVLFHFWGWIKEHRPELAQSLNQSPLEPAVLAVMTFLILTNPGAPRGFIYFQF
jgi:alginate O-acetyltransferase complex protein AlgI